MGLWEEYKLEREGVYTINQEHGFLTYKIHEDVCFIVDIYTDKNHRNGSAFLSLSKQATEIAKLNKCKYLEAHVWCNTENPTLSLRAILSFGFKVIKADNNVIYLLKEI